MLFGMVYTRRNTTEDNDKRTLALFTSWTPPQSLTLRPSVSSLTVAGHGDPRGHVSGGDV